MERLSLQEQVQEPKEQGQKHKEHGKESKEQREGHEQEQEQEVWGQEVTADSLQLLLASCIRPGPQQVSHINRSDFGLHIA